MKYIKTGQEITWKRDRAYYERDAWRGKWAIEGGGLLINQAIHTLDFICYLIGEVKSIQAHMFNYSLQDVIEVEDTLTAYLGFEQRYYDEKCFGNKYG